MKKLLSPSFLDKLLIVVSFLSVLSFFAPIVFIKVDNKLKNEPIQVSLDSKQLQLKSKTTNKKFPLHSFLEAEEKKIQKLLERKDPAWLQLSISDNISFKKFYDKLELFDSTPNTQLVIKVER